MTRVHCLPARFLWAFLLLAFFIVPWNSSLLAKEKRKAPIEFVVIIPSYNNSKWCEKNLESVFCQTYPHWFLHYINDCSTDDTGKKVDNYVQSRNMGHKCRIVHNKKNQGATANWYHTVNSYPANKVIVCLDGDDFVKDKYVLAKLAKIYSDPNVWMSYGSHITSFGKLGIRNGPLPKKVIEKRLFRKYKWVTSHMRTFYAGLFQQIRKESFMFEGKFMPTTCDLAMMFPMLEMASKGHIYYNKEIFYIYNIDNPLMDCVVHRPLQAKIEHHIRSQKRYEPLSTSSFRKILEDSSRKTKHQQYSGSVAKSISPLNTQEAA